MKPTYDALTSRIAATESLRVLQDPSATREERAAAAYRLAVARSAAAAATGTRTSLHALEMLRTGRRWVALLRG